MRGCTACVPGGRCVCNDIEHEQSRRVAIQQRVSQLADEVLRAVDPPLQSITDVERLVMLGDGFYALEQYVRMGMDPGEALVGLAAEIQLWLESREREAAR